MDLQDWFALFVLATSIYNAGYVHYLKSLIPAATQKSEEEVNTGPKNQKNSKEEVNTGTRNQKNSEDKVNTGPKNQKNSEEKAAVVLDQDVVEYGILPRLPAKALLRLQCVARKWHALISSDPHFVCLQLSWLPSASGGAVVSMGRHFHQFRTPVGLVSRDPRSVGIPPRFPFRIVGETIHFGTLVASCSGILCIVGNNLWVKAFIENPCLCSPEPVLFIGNPALKDWVRLPFPPNYPRKWLGFGLAVDVCRELIAYNLVFINMLERDTCNEYGFHVFSSRTQQWRLSKERILVPHYSQVSRVAVYVKGCLYWMLGPSRALWFNPKQERSGLLALPSEKDPDPRVTRILRRHLHTGFERDLEMIGEWNDTLSYATIKSEEIQVWSMQDESCWSKIHSISLEKVSRGLQRTCEKQWEILLIQREVSLMPFQDEDALWFILEGAIYCYDMATEEVSKQADYKDHSFLFPYKNSLLSLAKP